MNEINLEDREIPKLLNFKPIAMKPITGFAYDYTQRIVLLDVLVCEKREATEFLLGFVNAIQNYLPPNKKFNTAFKSTNIKSTFECIEVFSLLIASFQEGAGGVVVEEAKVTSIRENEDKSSTVTIALPTISPSLCINTTGQLYKFLLASTERDLRADQKWLSDSCNMILKNLARYAPRGNNNKHFIRAAINMKIPFTFLPQNNIQFGYGKGARLFNSSTTDETSGIAIHLAKDKRASNLFLKRAGFPVATQIPVKTLDQTLETANKIGYPVVLKPIDRDLGQGVYSRVASPEQLKAYFTKAINISNNLVLENHFPGKNYRINVVRGKVVRVREQLGAHVMGDGTSTIASLIETENKNPNRGTSEFFDLKPIKINEALTEVLSTQNLTIESIPPKEQKVWLAHHTNNSHGGTVKEATNTTHPDNIDLCVRATALFGLDICGIDLIIDDISKSYRDVGCIICEMNAMPQLNGSEPSIHGSILKEYVKNECFINVKVISEDEAEEITSTEHLILDRGLDKLEIHVPIDDLFKNGLPVIYMDELHFSMNLNDEQVLRVKREYSQYLR